MYRNKPTALGKGGCWIPGRWLRSGDPFLKEHGAGLQLCCRTLKGDVTALPAITKSVQMHSVLLHGTKSQGDSGDMWLPPPMAEGSLATDSLTPEMPALSFSVRFA